MSTTCHVCVAACPQAQQSAAAGVPSKTANAAAKHAPRAYITKAELASCSSYLKGRVTVEKVNAAIDEFAGAQCYSEPLIIVF
jgi:Spindle and kinetochore-associated protein 1